MASYCQAWLFLSDWAGIFQQPAPDSRPNNSDSALMFLLAGLVYMLACKKADAGT